MLKLLLAVSLALAPIDPAIPQTVDQKQPTIPRVICRNDHGYTAGTAFRIGPGLLLTAAHVVRPQNCEIEGKAINVTYISSPRADWAILSDNRPADFLKVDCGGFQRGHRYVVLGHARGADNLFPVGLVATGEYEAGLSALVGIFTAQPGHSGGPIIDAETMRVAGLVSAASWERGLTFAVELKGLSVCGGNNA